MQKARQLARRGSLFGCKRGMTLRHRLRRGVNELICGVNFISIVCADLLSVGVNLTPEISLSAPRLNL
jgi:hypothetical protein